jgi:hypothetical protein
MANREKIVREKESARASIVCVCVYVCVYDRTSGRART